MAWVSFGALPCRKRNLMTARVSILLKSRATLTCLRACFLPGRAKDLSAPRVCMVFLCSLTLILLHISHDRSNWSSPSFSGTTSQNSVVFYVMKLFIDIDIWCNNEKCNVWLCGCREIPYLIIISRTVVVKWSENRLKVKWSEVKYREGGKNETLREKFI